MRDDNYIVIPGWAINHLNLKGNDLMVYSIVYGFSQDGESEFTGSIQYLCDCLNVSKPTIIKNTVIKKFVLANANINDTITHTLIKASNKRFKSSFIIFISLFYCIFKVFTNKN